MNHAAQDLHHRAPRRRISRRVALSGSPLDLAAPGRGAPDRPPSPGAALGLRLGGDPVSDYLSRVGEQDDPQPRDAEAGDEDATEAEQLESEDEFEGRRRSGIGRKLTDSLLTSLLEGGAKIKRGQDRVTGAAQGTKEELLRMVGTEVRGFLDKIDVVDMMQKVVSGLVIDVNAQIRIRHDDGDEKLKTEISKSDIKLKGESRRKNKEPDA